jgi:hypothetical protein
MYSFLLSWKTGTICHLQPIRTRSCCSPTQWKTSLLFAVSAVDCRLDYCLVGRTIQSFPGYLPWPCRTVMYSTLNDLKTYFLV